jgi:hypothetical protein
MDRAHVLDMCVTRFLLSIPEKLDTKYQSIISANSIFDPIIL